MQFISFVITISGVINQARPLYSLDRELVLAHRHTVDELYGAPQPVKLCTFIDVHDAIIWDAAVPRWVVQVSFEAGQNDLEHREAATEALPGEQISLASDVRLLQISHYYQQCLFAMDKMC